MPIPPSPASTSPASTTSRRWPACSLRLVRTLLILLVAGPLGPAIARSAPCTPLSRVDLYFGGRAGDGARWRRFVAGVVTPRFPLGLTMLDGDGQWRDRGRLTRERTHILVIYYRHDATSDARIEAIRAVYKARFHQTSVLRADTSACVGF